MIYCSEIVVIALTYLTNLIDSKEFDSEIFYELSFSVVKNIRDYNHPYLLIGFSLLVRSCLPSF